MALTAFALLNFLTKKFCGNKKATKKGTQKNGRQRIKNQPCFFGQKAKSLGTNDISCFSLKKHRKSLAHRNGDSRPGKRSVWRTSCLRSRRHLHTLGPLSAAFQKYYKNQGNREIGFRAKGSVLHSCSREKQSFGLEI